MPLYGKDAWSDEDFLAAEWDEQGLFWRLAWWQWQEGSIPDDLKKILNVIGKPNSTRRLWPKMKTFFVPVPGKDGRLFNEKLDEFRGEAITEKEGRSRGAQVTNAKRWGDVAERSLSDSLDSSLPATPERVVSRIATAIAIGSRSPEGEREGEPPDPPGLSQAVLRLKPRFAQVKLRTEPSIAMLAGWVQRFGEDLILETLADCEERLKGKDFRYLETILVNRKENPAERPGARSKGKTADELAGLGGNGRDTPEQLRRDDIREAAMLLKNSRDPQAKTYLGWLAPDGRMRDEAMTFDEWKAIH